MAAPPPAPQVHVSAQRDAYVAGRDLLVQVGAHPDGPPAGTGVIDSEPLVHDETFVSRGPQLAALAGYLRRPRRWRRRRPAVRTVVLDGSPGTGKSTLMREAAIRHRGAFDGVVMIDLLGSSSEPMPAAKVVRELTRRLGASTFGQDDAAVLRQYGKTLEGKRVLVLLDDAADAEQVRRAVEFPGSSVVLVTSRVELPGLPSSARIGVGSFTEVDALRLLANTVSSDRVALEPAVARRIVRRCGYLPLAIKLVGGRIAAESRQDVSLAELDELLAAQGLGAIATRSTATSPAQTIRDIFDGSYRRLNAAQQRMFRVLGTGPRVLDAVSAGALADLPAAGAAELLRDLHGYRLIDPVAGGPGRYRLHDLLWQFAGELAAADGRLAADAGRRLAALRLRTVEDLAAGADLTASRSVAAAAEPEVARARARGDDETCWRLVAALADLYEAVGFGDGWPAMFEAGRSAAEACGDEARDAMALADAIYRTCQWQWAAVLDAVPADAYPDLNRAAVLRSRAHTGLGRPGRSVREAHRVVEATAADDPDHARALLELGRARQRQGEDASEVFRRAVAASGAHPRLRSRALAGLGDLDAAAELAEENGDIRHLFTVTVARAARHARAGERSQALRALQRAGERLTGHVLPPGYLNSGDTSSALLTMAETYLALGRPDEARVAHSRADTWDIAVLEARSAAVGGAISLALGEDLAEAAGSLRRAADSEPSRRDPDQVRAVAQAAALLGDLYCGLDDFEAGAHYHDRHAALTGVDDGRAAEAHAAAAGSRRARARARRRMPARRRHRWPLTGVGLVLGFLVIALVQAYDPSGAVGPVNGALVLACCTVATLVAVRMRPRGAGVLIGYVAAAPFAYGLILVTSEQARGRQTAGSLAALGVAAAGLVIAVLRHDRPVLLRLTVLAMLATAVIDAVPGLAGRAAPGPACTLAAVALMAIGVAWPVAVVLRHPSSSLRPPERYRLITAPIAAAGLAVLLAIGLGRQSTMFWPGVLGVDWRLAMMGIPVAAVCVLGALVEPDRLAGGLFAGQAWLWGISLGLLGMAHTPTPAPNFYLHIVSYWHWLTGAPAWVWLLPLLSLGVVLVLAIGGAESTAAEPLEAYQPRRPRRAAEHATDRPRLPQVDPARWVRGRLYTARGRLYTARGLLVFAAYVLALIPAGLRTADPAGTAAGLLVWAVLASLAAQLIHPDVRLLRAVHPRWLLAGAMVAASIGLTATAIVHLAAHGWSRGWAGALVFAAALLCLTVLVAPYRTYLRTDRWVTGLSFAGLGLMAAGVVVTAEKALDIVLPVLGGAVGGVGTWLYARYRRRRSAKPVS